MPTRTVFLSAILIALSACSDQVQDINKNPAQETGSVDVTLGISFPPVADENQRDFALPLLEELNVKQIRIGERWEFREPTPGNFNWGPLDDRISWATQNNIEILLTIQSDGPDWACSPLRNENSCVYKNNSDFQNYIETLLQRYPNQIQRIQYGNEWQSDFWYIGNGEQFTAANNIVYNAIQQFSPQTKLVLGGFTTISLRFLAGCGGQIDSFYNNEGILIDQDFLDANCSSPEFQYVVEKINTILKNAQYDEIDIHLYDDAENWPVFFDVINTMVRKPIIVTEFGGPNVNIEPVDEQYQAERLERYIRQIDALGITDAYFFKLVEGTNNPAHIKSGLIRAADLSKKQSFFTFKTLNQ